jgi:conjugative coupling factor TraD (SXT/TOL subfamily)
LANYSNLSQLTTRIINILPPSDDEAFKNFSWRAILAILHAMKILGIKPSLLRIRKAISTDFAYLVKDASLYYFRQVNAPITKITQIEKIEDKKEAAQACVEFYATHLKDRYASRDLEQLYSFYSLDKAFMDKLIQNIIPILEMLTAPPLDKLLSPETDDMDPRPIITLQTVVNTRGFLYCNLAALSDVKTAQALGALLINDATNVVANRYFFEDDAGASVPMNIFIDEASSIISHSVIAASAMSRGAHVSLNMAFQTIPDLEVRLGTPAAGEIVLGNMYNKTCFRIADETTQKYMSTQFGETTYKKMDYGFVTQQTTIKDLDFNNSYSKQISHEDCELVPTAALKDLPVAHFFTVADEVYKCRIPFIEVSDDLRYKPVVYHQEGSVNLPSLEDIATTPIGVMEFTQEVKKS